jgi:hypothetical protein
MRVTHFWNAQTDQQLRDLCHQNTGPSRTADILGTSARTVKRRMNYLGLSFQDARTRKEGDKETIIAMCLAGHSQHVIAESVGCSQSTVSGVLAINNIKRANSPILAKDEAPIDESEDYTAQDDRFRQAMAAAISGGTERMPAVPAPNKPRAMATSVPILFSGCGNPLA